MARDKRELIREAAEKDLETFVRLVHPNRVLGAIHSEVMRWWNREGRKTHQLLLLPRDHQKSALLAYRVAHAITCNPALRILYISSTSNLAIKQLKFIKDILTSEIYTFYWPEMVHPEEAKREKWTETEISVDHPLRKAENIREPTIFTAGLTTNIVGLHCDIAVLDDVVVNETAYTEEGRQRLETQYSFLASIEGVNGEEWVAGTRYHPKDLYNTLLNIRVDEYNKDGDVVSSEPLYEVFERPVENRGDGTGEFLWPRQQRSDGKWFGFDSKILARKKAQYVDKVQFRAQYYNDPNDISSAGIKRENFQYYDRSFLSRSGGNWYFKSHRLNVFAAVDFAYSVRKTADYTAIVVVGIDAENNYYVLDIDRFQTTLISEYYQRIFQLYKKWGFSKLRAEVTAAQQVIVTDLKQNYIRKYGLALSIDEYRPTRTEGSKQERVNAILQPKYSNNQVWHYHGGNCQVLEEELLLANPPHDDVKDCLASVIDFAIPPTRNLTKPPVLLEDMYHRRFGGVM